MDEPSTLEKQQDMTKTASFSDGFKCGVESRKEDNTMKILVANIPAAQEKSEGGQFLKSVVVPLWRRNLDLVKQKDTELTFRFASSGMTHPAFSACRYLPQLNPVAIFHAIVQGEKEGFDGAMIACFGDPMLSEVRRTVKIPVASLGESSLLAATMMGSHFGIVTPSSFVNAPLAEAIARYGLSSRFAGLKESPEKGDQQEMALTDSHYAIECFREVGRKLIADGAKVLVPACGLMSPALRMAPGAEKDYPGGFTKVDDVPIVDIMAVTLKMMEMMVALKKAGSSWVNPKGFPEALAGPNEFGSVGLGVGGLTFWDC
jgi:Asp/Glu/hydantoin racemase